MGGFKGVFFVGILGCFDWIWSWFIFICLVFCRGVFEIFEVFLESIFFFFKFVFGGIGGGVFKELDFFFGGSKGMLGILVLRFLFVVIL